LTRFHWLGAVLGVGILLTGCSPAGNQPTADQTATAQPCSLSTLDVGPDGYGSARAGPLWLWAFGRDDPGTPAVLSAGAGPYDGWKVLIHPDPSSTGMVELTGMQCSTGKAVRFCYGACDWNSRLQVSVTRLSVDLSSHLDQTGYMVFPGPGLMRLTTRDPHGVMSSVVVEVPAVPIAAEVPPVGSQRLEAACGTTGVYTGGSLPDWATVNAPKGLPYVVASPGLAVGYIFSYPLPAGSAANAKILWYVATPRDGFPLKAVGHPLGSATPTAEFSKAADSFPGEIYPSNPTVPSPGCWHFTLTWHGGDEQVDVDLAFQ
jgi:hypothetical protein